jgi:hypothetical protein
MRCGGQRKDRNATGETVPANWSGHPSSSPWCNKLYISARLPDNVCNPWNWKGMPFGRTIAAAGWSTSRRLMFLPKVRALSHTGSLQFCLARLRRDRDSVQSWAACALERERTEGVTLKAFRGTLQARTSERCASRAAQNIVRLKRQTVCAGKTMSQHSSPDFSRASARPTPEPPLHPPIGTTRNGTVIALATRLSISLRNRSVVPR